MEQTLSSLPKVSVICPTYNCGKYIFKTISSILNQTYQNFEILIIDDNSKDNTIDIIRSFSDERIVLYQNPTNKGVAYSRNFAIKHSSGDYIAFLDGDDSWYPEKLEKQISFMLINGYNFTYTYYDVLSEKSMKKTCYYKGPKKLKHSTFMKICYVGCLTVVYKKSVYPDLSIPENILKRNDYALWLLLSKKTDCYLLPEILSTYTKRTKNSISSGSKLKLFKYHISLYRTLFSYGQIKSFFCSVRNIFYYVFKQLVYKKHIK